jgi:hypothetical protein
LRSEERLAYSGSRSNFRHPPVSSCGTGGQSPVGVLGRLVDDLVFGKIVVTGNSLSPDWALGGLSKMNVIVVAGRLNVCQHASDRTYASALLTATTGHAKGAYTARRVPVSRAASSPINQSIARLKRPPWRLP